MTSTIEHIAHQAVLRRAHERLLLIGEMRDAHRLKQSGKSQREIAAILRTTQPRVGRLLRGARALGDAPTAEELILRATVDGTSRAQLVKKLCSLECTLAEATPYPHDDSRPGTWHQVRAAYLLGLLDDDEYTIISSVTDAPVGAQSSKESFRE